MICRRPSLLVTLLSWATLIAPEAHARDNFIIFLLDDIGVDGINVYSRDDLYGHDGEGANPGVTDTVDALALDGILFRNAWTQPVCAPTRAQLLTGRHAHRTGIGIAGGALLDLAERILPEMLAATHQSAAVGKWHVGSGADPNHPNDSGFDTYAGDVAGNIGDYDLWDKTVNGLTTTGHAVYATTDAANEAIAAVQGFGENPFLLYVAFNAPHAPFHVPDASLQGTGIDSSASSPEKWKAMIEAADTEMQNILDALSPGVRADTHIFVIGDNGSPAGATEAPFLSNRAKGTVYEGGLNVPFIVWSPRIPAANRGTESLALVSTADVFATIGQLAGADGYTEDSVSIVPYLDDPTASTQAIRPYAFAERFRPNGAPPYTEHERALRDDTYKLIWRDGIYEEFYDLDDDRWEGNSLLPVANLDPNQLAAYDTLVAYMEGVEDPLPQAPASSIPTLPGAGPGILTGLFVLSAAVTVARSRAAEGSDPS